MKNFSCVLNKYSRGYFLNYVIQRLYLLETYATAPRFPCNLHTECLINFDHLKIYIKVSCSQRKTFTINWWLVTRWFKVYTVIMEIIQTNNFPRDDV